MTASDIKVSLEMDVLFYDKSEDKIANTIVVEKKILKGIGKLETTDKVRLKVSLQKEGESAMYTFSQACIVPCTVLHLPVGQLAFKNIRLLVSDDKMRSKDHLIGFLVLCHLHVDAATLPLTLLCLRII